MLTVVCSNQHDLPNTRIGSPETTSCMRDCSDSKDARGMSTIDLHAESQRDERSLAPAGAVGRWVHPKCHSHPPNTDAEVVLFSC
jgi:hypothetical protein